MSPPAPRLSEPFLPGICPVAKAVESLAAGKIEERGAVYTRREVVDFILDLAGYTADRPLYQYRLLEPSFGNGDFLLPAIERLIAAYTSKVADTKDAVMDLSGAIYAVEIHQQSISDTKKKARALLASHGLTFKQADCLLDAWIVTGDFLLAEIPNTFSHVVGNPPYVRQELISDVLMAEYRARYNTIYDRADIYVPFIERSLSSLGPGGVLAFICADRWMKNRYGGPLRDMISRSFHLTHYVDMIDTPAFHSDVAAYPAITVFKRGQPGPTRIAHRPIIASSALAVLAKAMRAVVVPEGIEVTEVADITNGAEPWILNSFDQLSVVRRLEKSFPNIEEAGCKIGIGVATGADAVFLGSYDALPVESSRKIPIVMTKDIKSGEVVWRGQGVINPFNDDGSLVNLSDYPKLAAYLNRHADVIRGRNVAKRNASGWYRTIDRIYPDIAYKEKLLIPDIKGEAHIVYESGNLYPHHNLYFITSMEWDLLALRAVLLSGIAKLFVETYSTRMRGGYLRFQAQYLRRIRLPRWLAVPQDIREALIRAAAANDADACNDATFRLYGLSVEERAVIGDNGN